MAEKSVFVYVYLFVINTHHIVSGKYLLDVMGKFDNKSPAVANPGKEPASNNKPVIFVIEDSPLKKSHHHELPKLTPPSSESNSEDDLLAKLLNVMTKKQKSLAPVARPYRRVKKLHSQKTPLSVFKNEKSLRSPILKNLLRVSNDLRCQAQEDCQTNCDRYSQESGEDCEKECEETHNCAITTPVPFTLSYNEACADNDNCNSSNSCNDDCPHSTMGYIM